MTTWKIDYTIIDGEYEYNDCFTHEAESLTCAEAMALVAAFWCGDSDPEDKERFRKTLESEGYAALPDDGRCITDLGWDPVSPIIVTVRNGLVEAVANVPENVTVEVRDWDNGELDGQGEPVPTVAEWTGPL